MVLVAIGPRRESSAGVGIAWLLTVLGSFSTPLCVMQRKTEMVLFRRRLRLLQCEMSIRRAWSGLEEKRGRCVAAVGRIGQNLAVTDGRQ